jgi:hypothetical protein
VSITGNKENEMTGVTIDQLAEQFEGRKFGDLVLHHMNEQPFEQIVVAMQGTMEGLPAQVRNEIEGLIDNANPLAFKKEFWADDCGKILRFITSMVEKELQEKEVQPSEDNLFDVFNIIVMNFAYSAYKDQRMKKFIKSSIGKGLFGRIFW